MNIGKTTPLQPKLNGVNLNTQPLNSLVNEVILSNIEYKNSRTVETLSNIPVLNIKACTNQPTKPSAIFRSYVHIYSYIVKSTLYLKNYAPLLVIKTHNILNIFWKTTVYDTTNLRLWFLNSYLHKSDLIWNDGFLLDFLQKKSLDLWIRKFVIYTGYIFSERVVFNNIVFIYDIIVVKTLSHLTALYNNSVLNILLTLVYTLLSILTLVALTVIII